MATPETALPGWEAPGWVSMIDRHRGVADALGLPDGTDLLGYSMGGGTAFHLKRKGQERFGRSILLARGGVPQEQCMYMDEYDIENGAFQTHQILLPTRMSRYKQRELCDSMKEPCAKRYAVESEETTFDIKSR